MADRLGGDRPGADRLGGSRFAVRDLDRDALVATRVVAARSLFARFRGLMGKRSLAPGEGLWLPGDNNIHMFFMRFAIDAIFLAPAGAPDGWRVVEVRTLRPWRDVVWWVRGARGCLEVAAGSARTVNVAPGDTLRFEAL